MLKMQKKVLNVGRIQFGSQIMEAVLWNRESPQLMFLKEIRKAVKNKIIIFDGGVRTGSDILKAISLGANIVSIGRPSLCGLIVNGS